MVLWLSVTKQVECDLLDKVNGAIEAEPVHQIVWKAASTSGQLVSHGASSRNGLQKLANEERRQEHALPCPEKSRNEVVGWQTIVHSISSCVVRSMPSPALTKDNCGMLTPRRPCGASLQQRMARSRAPKLKELLSVKLDGAWNPFRICKNDFADDDNEHDIGQWISKFLNDYITHAIHTINKRKYVDAHHLAAVQTSSE